MDTMALALVIAPRATWLEARSALPWAPEEEPRRARVRGPRRWTRTVLRKGGIDRDAGR